MHVFMLFLGLMLVSIGCSSGNAPRDAQPDVRKGSMIVRDTGVHGPHRHDR